MASLCLFCGEKQSTTVSLVEIIDSFKVILRLLEVHSSQDEQKASKSNLQEMITQNRNLEKEKRMAEERSNIYKTRFWNAQEALQKLHKENVRLSRSSQEIKEIYRKNTSMVKTNEMQSFPFAPERSLKNEKTVASDKVVLAPDTCFFQPVNADVTYISSDEEHTTIDPPAILKSSSFVPQSQKTIFEKKNKPSGVNNTFFDAPKNILNSVKRELSAADKISLVDMDETRMDVCENADSDAVVSPDVPSKDKDCFNVVINDNDSIPPSPVLSVGRDRRIGMARSNIGKNTNLQSNIKTVRKISNEKRCRNVSFPKKNNEIDVKEENTEIETNSQNWASGPAQDSLQLLRKKKSLSQGASKKPATVNTSLDDLFDKTDGDLETTSMLNNTTFVETNLNSQCLEQSAIIDSDCNDDDEEELDALLLLQGIQNVEENDSNRDVALPPKNIHEPSINSPASILGESFDFVPKKREENPNFKYKDVVRKHDERKKLEGKECVQCEAFYSDLPEAQKKAKLQEVCRHKHVYIPPSTPDHFWEVDFPNTAECKRRGYIVDHADLPTQVKLQQQSKRFRRKKPLS